MNKIIQLSEYGFKLDQNPDKWISCDKKFINGSVFKSLMVGDIITNMTLNDKGFVVGTSRVSLGNSEQKGGSLSTPKSISPNLNSNIVPSSVQDSIRYAQCVNIAFENQSLCNINLMYDGDNNWSKKRIEETFDIADKIYIEFNKRCLK